MKTRQLVSACLGLLLVTGAMFAAVLAQDKSQDKQIPADQAIRFGGKDGMVCGKVESAKFAQNTEGQPTFLHLGAPFPRHTFSVKILGVNRDKWPSPPDELVGQLICVTGKITRAGATRAEMEIDNPSQMKLGVAK